MSCYNHGMRKGSRSIKLHFIQRHGQDECTSRLLYSPKRLMVQHTIFIACVSNSYVSRGTHTGIFLSEGMGSGECLRRKVARLLICWLCVSYSLVIFVYGMSCCPMLRRHRTCQTKHNKSVPVIDEGNEVVVHFRKLCELHLCVIEVIRAQQNKKSIGVRCWLQAGRLGD